MGKEEQGTKNPHQSPQQKSRVLTMPTHAMNALKVFQVLTLMFSLQFPHPEACMPSDIYVIVILKNAKVAI